MRVTRYGMLFVVSVAVLAAVAAPAAADETDEDRIRRLESEVAELKAMVEELRSAGLEEARLAEVERRLEVLAREMEDLKLGEAGAVAPGTAADSRQFGLSPAAAKVYGKDQGVSVGGYGEALLQVFDDEREDGTASGAVDTFDFLRAIVYFGYKFNDRWVLNTEIEYEHASTSAGGSVSVEFAYLDYLYRDELNLRAGLVLLPMGWLNELHEPTVFLGATRPEAERVIIPSTWRENGVGAWGSVGAFDYRTYVVNGLDASGFSAGGLRGGRQKGGKAKAEDFAWTGRVDLVGVPGLTAGVAAYVGDSGQDLVDGQGRGIAAKTTIFDLHAEYRYRGLELRGLYAKAAVDDVARLNAALGYVGSDSIGESLVGAYVQAGYDVLSGGGRSSLTPYLRWERVDTQNEVPEGWAADPANDRKLLTLGLAYQPIEQLIFKAEYQDVSNDAQTGIDRFNLSLGYIF